MTKKSVMIAVPAYSWAISTGTVRSLFADMMALRDRGDDVTLFDESGSTDLSDARAVMVAKALDAGVTHLVNVDADVFWQKGALVGLVDSEVDMVGAAYPRRLDPISWPVRFLGEGHEPSSDVPPPGQLMEVAGAPGGFIRYTRACLEQMVEAYPDLQYRSAAFHSPLTGLFDPIRVNGGKLTEDNSFAHRWRAIGGKVWLNPWVKMGHIGPKAFIGCLGDWLNGRQQTTAA